MGDCTGGRFGLHYDVEPSNSATPTLVEIGKVRADDRPNAPTHRLIKGENLHALRALAPEYAGNVDLIYIDPPYNTGNKDWVYNDQFIRRGDANRHARWMAFMHERLALARALLADTGVIFVAIGDEEHHRLRVVMDNVFGEENFLSNIVWAGAIKNNVRLASNVADYMLVYARDHKALKRAGTTWREAKPGVGELKAAASIAWKESDGDPVSATKALRAWLLSLPRTHPIKVAGRTITNYKWVDGTARPGEVYATSALDSPLDAPKYDVLHPVTGKPVKKPQKGWRVSQETMTELVSANMIHFGPDESQMPYRKRFLDDSTQQVPGTVFHHDRRVASLRLAEVLGDDRFPYPKDVDVLMRWIRMAAPKDGLILDFFGGSGSTCEAVMRLNHEDDGTRTCILITNNELARADSDNLTRQGHAPGDPEWEARGVFENVTLPRITTVATGVRPDGVAYEKRVPANVSIRRA